jgi:hypothetical protein
MFFRNYLLSRYLEITGADFSNVTHITQTKNLGAPSMTIVKPKVQ